MKRWITIVVLVSITIVLFGSLVVTGGKLDIAKAQITVLEQKLAAIKSELSLVKSNLDSTQLEVTKLKTENEKLRAIPRYTLRDPTYKEMMDFLLVDQTDRNRWVRDVYDCKHFSQDVKDAAQEKGFRCAIVLIQHPVGGHMLVAFQTTDRGLIFIEPQNDKKVKVEKGIRYWRDQGEYSNIDDTIVDIVIVW